MAQKHKGARGVRRVMVAAVALGTAATIGTAAPVQAQPQQATVSAWVSDGWGGGTVTSRPAGINCHQEAWPSDSTEYQQEPTGSCHADFPVGTTVTFTATADPGSFVNYGPAPASLTVRAGYNATHVMFCPDHDLCTSW
ncbi:hypothetical protein ACFY7C_01040 [Streptomyces sp. NPDC012769]|uniref:hypothetical protein n=1 Tax=Streptomyces sp. NPDC012769 TaxID=3364848 RepID=UPI00368C9B8C